MQQHDSSRFMSPIDRCLMAAIAFSIVLITVVLRYQYHDVSDQVFWQLRLPRVISAFSIGGMLSLSGLLLQSLLRNPLAEPYILGAASSSALLVLLGMLLGFPWWGVQLAGFVGALLVLMLMMWFLSRYGMQDNDMTFYILLGVLISALLQVGVQLILMLMPNQALRSAMFWLMGDLSGAGRYYIPLIGFLVCGALVLPIAGALETLKRGAHMALAHGLHVRRLQMQLLLIAGMATSICVSEAGALGFIGLIVPQAVQSLPWVRVQYAPKRLLVLSMISGGILLLIADAVAQFAFAPYVIPTGMITTLIGTPTLMMLLWRRYLKHGRPHA